ncbi:MAG: Fe-S cluster assembly ATPase SufC [Actinomycetota bacterium]|nr:Fe-S cluster assembly ATPase SufC [Actinomycetota bacterium]
MANRELIIEDLHVSIDGKEIVKGFSIEVKAGQVHAIMGPNGSGKTTLASAIMGKAGYQITKGKITLDGEDITHLPTYKRARSGIFLISQLPSELGGVYLDDIRRAQPQESDFRVERNLEEELSSIGLDRELADRAINVGFSGGEKKRFETLQLSLLGAKLALLDELDSGLDIDALREVSRRISRMVKEEGLMVIAITHYSRLLKELVPDVVHVYEKGKITESGNFELAFELEKTGYQR